VPLSAKDKDAMLRWIRAGHGFVGIHSAADSNYTWPQFAELAGGLFKMHWYDFGGFTFEPQTLELRNEDPNNPIVAHVGSTWKISDETYAWQVNPRADVHVLLSMVNTTVAEGALYDNAQPLAWCRPFGAGRTFYTNQATSTRSIRTRTTKPSCYKASAMRPGAWRRIATTFRRRPDGSKPSGRIRGGPRLPRYPMRAAVWPSLPGSRNKLR
jgi:type 1 glutamine amidotransferase